MFKIELKRKYFDILQMQSYSKGSKEYSLALRKLRYLSPYIVEDLRKGTAEGDVSYRSKYQLWFRLCIFLLSAAFAAVLACIISDVLLHNSTALVVSMALVGVFLLAVFLCVLFANRIAKKYLCYSIEHFKRDQQNLSDEEIRDIIDAGNSCVYNEDEEDTLGCYNCESIFTADMAEQIDYGQYRCPFCYSAKVIDESVRPITSDFLLHMHHFWMEDVEIDSQLDEDAIETIRDYDDFIIEIYKKPNAFTYRILYKRYEDNGDKCHIYWTPIDDGTQSFFDTKEKAVKAAKDAWNQL